jgi:hypothetical protein
MRVKVDRQTLLSKLTANRNTHKQEFEEAWIDYLSLAKKELRKAARNVDKTEKSSPVKAPSLYPIPASHEDDYDRIIGLLQFTEDEEIELDDRDYERYVLDNWEWKEQFATTNAFYKR